MRLLRRMMMQQQQQPRMLGSDPYHPANNPYDDGYPGHRARPPDLTDVAQIVGLGIADGDTDANHQTLNHPWGKVVRLAGDGKSVALVQTEAFPRPFPWAIQARFSIDGRTFTPTVPGTWGGQVIFRFTKSFDVKTGPATDTFTLEAGDALPICSLIARKLTVTAQIVGEAVLNLWVQFVVCPTQQIDCAELVPPTPPETTPQPFTEAAITRIASTLTLTQFLPEPRRAYLTIANQSTQTLYVALDPNAEATPGDEHATIVLPPGAFAGYEVLNYTGAFSMVWDVVDATGYALVTQGLYPA